MKSVTLVCTVIPLNYFTKLHDFNTVGIVGATAS